MTDDELDALLSVRLADVGRAPDESFARHNAKRVALQVMIVRETKAALHRGLRDLLLALALIAMLIAWSGSITESYGLAAIILPLLVIGFWSIGHDWSFPDFSFGAGSGGGSPYRGFDIDDAPIVAERTDI